MTPSAQEIREARQKAGLTQSEAAELVELSKAAWSAYEQGQRYMMPSTWRLFRILTGQERVPKWRKKT